MAFSLHLVKQTRVRFFLLATSSQPAERKVSRCVIVPRFVPSQHPVFYSTSRKLEHDHFTSLDVTENCSHDEKQQNGLRLLGYFPAPLIVTASFERLIFILFCFFFFSLVVTHRIGWLSLTTLTPAAASKMWPDVENCIGLRIYMNANPTPCLVHKCLFISFFCFPRRIVHSSSRAEYVSRAKEAIQKLALEHAEQFSFLVDQKPHLIFSTLSFCALGVLKSWRLTLTTSSTSTQLLVRDLATGAVAQVNEVPTLGTRPFACLPVRLSFFRFFLSFSLSLSLSLSLSSSTCCWNTHASG